MPHEVHSMMYVGRVPWHGLGVQLPHNANAEDVVRAAGFYEAVEKDLFIDSSLVPVPDRKALCRADTGAYLATVSRKYVPVQFQEMARVLVKAAAGVDAVFHTAGTLGRAGVRGWLLAELPGEMRIKGDRSPIKKYLLGYTAHDGTTAITLKSVATRVVCANTLGAALGERHGAEWTIPHCGDPLAQLDSAAEAFRRLAAGYARFEELANALASVRFTERQLTATLDFILPVPDDEHEHPRIQRQRAKVVELYHAGTGIDGAIRGTAWGALQCWCEWADHFRTTRDIRGRRMDELRMESTLFGASAAIKKQALFAVAGEARLPLAA